MFYMPDMPKFLYAYVLNAFRMHTLRTSKPQVIIGDFNSHSINWGYNESILDGDAVEAWAEASQLSLVHNAKLPKSFNSGPWKRGYNPDIAFVSHSIASLSKKLVLEPLPKSQQCPIGITVTSAVSTASVPNRCRFNLKKANWEGFSDELEHLLQELKPIPDNYDQFSEMFSKTARRNIPRGCYTNYIPGLTPTARRMYSTYKHLCESDPFSPKTIAAGEDVINATSQQRQSTWQTTAEGMDMARNSRRAWNLIGKLNNDNTKSTQQHCNITANKIAHQMLLNGKTSHSVKQLKPNLKTDDFNPHFSKPFSPQKLKCYISTLKNGNATGLDNILTEKLKHFGPKALNWLLQFYNNCIATMNTSNQRWSSLGRL